MVMQSGTCEYSHTLAEAKCLVSHPGLRVQTVLTSYSVSAYYSGPGPSPAKR